MKIIIVIHSERITAVDFYQRMENRLWFAVLSGCVYCMRRQETNAQLIGATMAYGDKQLKHPNGITWEISKRLTESRTLRAFVFFIFYCANGSGKRAINRIGVCVCVSVRAAWLQRSKHSDDDRDDDDTLRDRTNITQNPKIYKF